MKWIDVYNYLCRLANDINNNEKNSRIWQQQIIVQNMETNDTYPAKIFRLKNNMLVIGIHYSNED